MGFGTVLSVEPLIAELQNQPGRTDESRKADAPA
jgi:hypothetical protein